MYMYHCNIHCNQLWWYTKLHIVSASNYILCTIIYIKYCYTTRYDDFLFIPPEMSRFVRITFKQVISRTFSSSDLVSIGNILIAWMLQFHGFFLIYFIIYYFLLYIYNNYIYIRNCMTARNETTIYDSMLTNAY